MSSNTRDWGLTILRLWMGVLAASTGYQMFEGLGPLSFAGLKVASVEAWTLVTIIGVWSLGGVAIFLGIATRSASFLSAAAAAYFIWKQIGTQAIQILEHPVHATIFVVGIVLILLGPGRLNLGSLLRKSK